LFFFFTSLRPPSEEAVSRLLSSLPDLAVHSLSAVNQIFACLSSNRNRLPIFMKSSAEPSVFVLHKLAGGGETSVTDWLPSVVDLSLLLLREERGESGDKLPSFIQAVESLRRSCFFSSSGVARAVGEDLIFPDWGEVSSLLADESLLSKGAVFR
jgi:hypothetical protein